MSTNISSLSAQEQALLAKVPAYIALLIGTADDALDSKESALAKQAVAFRIEPGEDITKAYYESASDQFDAALKAIAQEYAALDPEARTAAISEVLSSVSPILGSLDIKLAHALLEGWRGIARAVAQASGSIIGSQAVSHEEMHLMGLNMIEIPR
jgi:hypothetical protein